MPRGRAIDESQTDHDECINDGNLGTCPVRDTRCLCATGTAPAYRWDAGIVCPVAAVTATLRVRFRLLRTRVGVGSADCVVCIVLGCRDKSPCQPDITGRGLDAKEGDVNWSDS